MPPVLAARELEPHRWGRANGVELWGPRHDYRETLVIRHLRRLLPASPGSEVLNAGCGPGSLTLRLLEAGYRVTSVDTSEPFVERLRAQVAERFSDAGPVELGDVSALSFGDHAFAAVVCGEVLEHLEDDRSAVREFARVLGPGGVVVATVPANPWRYDWVDWWAGHRRRYTVDGLRARFEEAGFADVRVVPWGFPLTGLYERVVYKRLLRRRLAGGSGPPDTASSPVVRRLGRVVRTAFELDSLFLGRRPGYLGLIVTARAPASAQSR